MVLWILAAYGAGHANSTVGSGQVQVSLAVPSLNSGQAQLCIESVGSSLSLRLYAFDAILRKAQSRIPEMVLLLMYIRGQLAESESKRLHSVAGLEGATRNLPRCEVRNQLGGPRGPLP